MHAFCLLCLCPAGSSCSSSPTPPTRAFTTRQAFWAHTLPHFFALKECLVGRGRKGHALFSKKRKKPGSCLAHDITVNQRIGPAHGSYHALPLSGPSGSTADHWPRGVGGH
jgi:hypothetical protein